jgi:hypothetical protein
MTQPVEWLISIQLTKGYYKEYFAITEPMYLKPREFKVLHRIGEAFVTVKKENGGVRD